MFKVIILCLMTMNASAENYAIVFGGADYYNDNIFTSSMAKISTSLIKRGWQVDVLFNSDFYTEDWKKFPKKLRPKKEKDPNYFFSKKNFVKRVDKILARGIGKDDQVYLNLDAHGTTIFGPHSTDWDSHAGQSEFKQLWNGLKGLFSPTSSKIRRSIEKLLATGARVHLDVISCYGGQMLFDFKDLTDKYPDQFCITTASAADRVFTQSNTYPIVKESGGSALEGFRDTLHDDYQSSFLPQWHKLVMNVLEKKMKYEDAICELRKRNESMPIVDGDAASVLTKTTMFLGMKKEMHKLSTLRKICSKQSQYDIQRKLKEFHNKNVKDYDHYQVVIDSNELPLLFQIKEGNVFSQGSRFLGNVESMKKSTKYESGYEKSVSVNWLVEEYTWPNNDLEDSRSKKSLREFIAKDKKLDKVFETLLERYNKFTEHAESMKCNLHGLHRLKRKLRSYYIDLEEEYVKNHPNSLRAKKYQACANFKY